MALEYLFSSLRSWLCCSLVWLLHFTLHKKLRQMVLLDSVFDFPDTMNNPIYPRFHLAFPVTDLEAARDFYCGILGCSTGRESDRWIDFDFFGHQLVAHLVAAEDHPSVATNAVDGHAVPASHFGVIMSWQQYEQTVAVMRTNGIEFVIEPYVRFAGGKGEQATLFVKDPSNNYLEFKAFRNIDMLFAKDLPTD